jgi:hypothetical protein
LKNLRQNNERYFSNAKRCRVLFRGYDKTSGCCG